MAITLHILFTVVMMLVFIGVCLWAFKSSNKQEFDRAARLPLEDQNSRESELERHV